METVNQFPGEGGESQVLPGASVLPPMDPPESTPEPSTEDMESKANNKRVTRDRFATLNRFVDVTMRDLTPSEKSVWLVLFRDTRDGVATTAQSDIAARSGLTQSTVSLAIRRLEERRLLTIIRQGGFRKGMSSYRIQGSA